MLVQPLEPESASNFISIFVDVDGAWVVEMGVPSTQI